MPKYMTEETFAQFLQEFRTFVKENEKNHKMFMKEIKKTNKRFDELFSFLDKQVMVDSKRIDRVERQLAAVV